MSQLQKPDQAALQQAGRPVPAMKLSQHRLPDRSGAATYLLDKVAD